jgi:hypothetical protein
MFKSIIKFFLKAILHDKDLVELGFTKILDFETNTFF